MAFLCQKFCDNKEDAEEVMQDIFVIAFKKPRDLRGDTLLAYLKKIAIHECFRKRKSQRQQQSFVLFSLDEDMMDIPDADEDFLPEESLRNKERQDELLQIINSLSKVQREMTYLYYYFNMNAEEIARLYNCTSSTVRANLHRARQAIKNRLEGKKKFASKKAAPAVLVALGALFFVEEQVFAASYLPATAGSTTAAAAATTATLSVSSVIKGCIVAACLVGVGVIGTILYLSTDDAPTSEIQPYYEIVTTPTEDSTAEPPATIVLPHITVIDEPPTPATAAPSTEALSEEPAPTESPITEPPITQSPITEPAATQPPATEPPITEPHITQPPATEPPITEPPETQPPITEPPPTEPPETQPPPADRTQAILASLAVATTPADVARIITYYGFADKAVMQTRSGTTFQFYVLDDGSGDILVGTGVQADGMGWHMRFDLFPAGQAPTDVMQRLLFMEYL
ncbi:MAG: sigma-70 family RNA polymerase sigma factor [Defluviitaleaceae bacterium]|nr:sigma-70 family RNA polymerase sigma factor [Defluviitaleaceae bacterium]